MSFAFDAPVVLPSLHEKPIRTVDEAVSILRTCLRSQFTVARLNTLLMLERAAEGSEIDEAREAFCAWASSEQATRRTA